MALNGPTNLPSRSCRSTPSCLRNFNVVGLWIRVKIVLRPVAILSALSRVVDLTEVNTAISSLSCFIGLPMSPEAALNTPPVRRITDIKSSDSTANLPATALREPRTFPTSLALIPN